jgi:integrase
MGRRKTNSIKGEELQSFVSVQNWLSSLSQASTSKGKDGLTIGAKRQRLGRMLEFTKFTGLNPDQLLAEAKQDINKAGTRLDEFFKARMADGIDWNTACTNLSFLRGFYTHNDLRFPKRFKLPSRKQSAVTTTDEKVPVYDYNEENGEAIFNKNLIQHFIQNLNFRDQTIALCLLSGGTDAADLLVLNVGFVKDGKGELCKRKRFFLKGNREKDGIPFKTLFSVEATEFIRRYVEQERSDAKNNEPLFAKKYATRERPEPKPDQFATQYIAEEKGRKVIEYQVVERLPVPALAFNFKSAAGKMGYKDESNPFRPKRFRGLFRTACNNAKINVGFVNAMMGHSTSISDSYLEQNDGLFIQEYIKLEPFVTVFGVNINETEIVTQIQDDMKELKVQTFDKTAELEKELKEIKGYFETLIQAIKVEDIGEFKEWLEAKRRAEFEKEDNEEKKKQSN